MKTRDIISDRVGLRGIGLRLFGPFGRSRTTSKDELV